MAIDAADPRTKRGTKLERERNSAKSQAKVWLICFFLAIIFFVSLRVTDSTPSPNCIEMNSCNCLDFFDAIFTTHLIILFFYTTLRVKLGCKSSSTKITRREIKTSSRQFDLCFSVLFQISTVFLLLSFLKDSVRDECQFDKRFQRMS